MHGHLSAGAARPIHNGALYYAGGVGWYWASTMGGGSEGAERNPGSPGVNAGGGIHLMRRLSLDVRVHRPFELAEVQWLTTSALMVRF
jgi:hypothetical protein